MVTTTKINKNNLEDIISLTPTQKGLIFNYISNKESEEYFEQLVLDVSGYIDYDIFKKSWNKVVQTNEALRTVFIWGNVEEPLQVILKNYQIPFKEFDVQAFDDIKKNELIKKLIDEDRKEKFDLSKGAFRVTICKIEQLKFKIIISNHHIIFDGWSTGIILKEFLETYNSLINEIEIKHVDKSQYKEFVKFYKKQNKDNEKMYWSNYLKGVNTQISLPKDRNKISKKDDFGVVKYILDEKICCKIKQFTEQHRITKAALLYGVWGFLLQKYNNSNDVVFGTVISGRNPNVKYIENMVGLFINTLPLRIVTDKNDKIVELLMKINRMLIEREEYEYATLSDIKTYCDLNGNKDIFESIMVIENYPLDKAICETVGGLKIDSYELREITNYNIVFEILNFDDLNIELHLKYNNDVFNPVKMKRVIEHYINILNEVLLEPNMTLGEINMISKVEMEKILIDFNNTTKNYPKNKLIHELFEEQVKKTPDNIALVFEEKRLTYNELNSMANKVARVLRRQGVKPDSIVGILMNRSIEMIISIYAVLKSGGCYLPIDPDYPEERIQYILEDSGAHILLKTPEIKNGTNFNGEIINFIYDTFQNEDDTNLEKICNAENLIYTIYTSGSTGNPKGVRLKQGSFMNLMNWFTEEFNINDKDKILLIASTSFDLSQKNIYATLIKGGQLCIYPPGLYDYNVMSEVIKKENITILNCTPSAFSPLIEFNKSTEYTRLKTLRNVFLGGEPININSLLSWVKSGKYKCEIVNTYGPTECTDIATYFRIDNKEIENLESVPIGKAIDNAKLYVLDSDLRILPIGVVGELFIGGVGVGKGYNNVPELTAEKFINITEFTESKVYRTGDLVKWNENGELEYVARLDNQVKIRGYRIELEEVENHLMKHEKIKSAAAIIRDDNKGNKFICCYLVLNSDLSVIEIKSILSKYLPRYMIPEHYIKIDKIPLNSNGKVDRNALLKFNKFISKEEDFKMPLTDLEKTMVDIIKDVLGKDKISVNDNLFDIGANSMTLIRLHCEIEKIFPGKIKISDLFTFSTVLELAEFIENKDKKMNRKIDIELLDFPEDYFLDETQSNNRFSYFEAEIKGSLYEIIVEFCNSSSINQEDVFLGIYILLLSKVTEKNRIPINVIPKVNENTITSLMIDFENIEDILGLFKQVKEEKVKNDTTVNINDLISVKTVKENAKIGTLFTYKDDLHVNAELLRVFDIVLGVSQKEDRAIFRIDYNIKRLKGKKLEQLFDSYMNLLVFAFKDTEKSNH